ncbi:hypothetical protein DFJ43DRAFT_1171279 [Lentinula guzmanii]|uniref:DUF4100 domain-containing protein n=1 Tax=Lentinula guzmanii TaxID=2804957 RepID=A0AA38JK85_9AGAR|nr:hypothetical protein DFJ43DRAFT_1171279 [Lentinula guzmanii]
MVNTRSRHARTTTEDSDNVQEEPVMANPFASNATAFAPFAESISGTGLPRRQNNAFGPAPSQPAMNSSTKYSILLMVRTPRSNHMAIPMLETAIPPSPTTLTLADRMRQQLITQAGPSRDWSSSLIPTEVPEEPEIVEPIKEVSPDLPGHPEDPDPEGSDPEGPPGGPGGPVLKVNLAQLMLHTLLQQHYNERLGSALTLLLTIRESVLSLNLTPGWTGGVSSYLRHLRSASQGTHTPNRDESSRLTRSTSSVELMYDNAEVLGNNGFALDSFPYNAYPTTRSGRDTSQRLDPRTQVNRPDRVQQARAPRENIMIPQVQPVPTSSVLPHQIPQQVRFAPDVSDSVAQYWARRHTEIVDQKR